MSSAPDLDPQRSQEYIYSLIAGLGGLAKYANKYLHTHRFRWGDILASILISGFSGFMFGELTAGMGWGYDNTIIAAGIGGFVGTEGIMFLWETVKSHIK